MSTEQRDKELEPRAEIELTKGECNEVEDVHKTTIHRAKAATEKEHRMTLWTGIRTYPKAIGWSCLISMCIAMEAFDLCLLNTFCMKTTLETC
jgi:SP family general alpha glucoside:H+ symporter-like MFS transporter